MRVEVFGLFENEELSTLVLNKDGVNITLDAEDFRELQDTLNGKNKVMHTIPKDGEYIGKTLVMSRQILDKNKK